MKRAPWFTITNLANKKASIALRGVIGLDPYWGGEGAGTFKQFERELSELGNVEEIELAIHSPGGQVFEGLPIYHALKNHPARIVATVEGLAGSIASVILMAADERRIPRNAYVMIHNAEGIEVGDFRAMRKMSEDLEKFTRDISALYARRTGLAEKTVSKMMDDVTWMNGEDAVANGFADTLTDAVEISNLARFEAASLKPAARSRATASALAFFDTSEEPSPQPTTPPNMTEAEMNAKIAAAEKATAEAKAAQVKAETEKADAEKAAADAKSAQDKAEADKVTAEKAAADAKSASETVENRLKKLENMADKGVLGASKGGSAVGGTGPGQQTDTTNLSPLQLMAQGREAMKKVA